MAAAAKPAKPAYELSGWERFKKDVVRDKWLNLLLVACFYGLQPLQPAAQHIGRL